MTEELSTDSDGKKVATFQPQECSTQGGEPLIITFSSPLPDDPLVIMLRGSQYNHKLQPEKIDKNSISALLPAHTLPEPVQVAVYWLPSNEQTATYQAILLMEDTIYYTDKTHALLAEHLINSVTDNAQSSIFYSMLPPLATMDIASLCEFDQRLKCAVEEVALPPGWNMVRTGLAHQETLLHFASKYSLSNLFSLLLTLPGGKDAVILPNDNNECPIDLAKESGCHEIVRIIEGLERESSFLASMDPSSTSMLTLPERRASLPLYHTIMKEIHGDWIHKQKLQNKDGLLNVPVESSKRASLSQVRSSHRPNSIAIMEGLNIREESPTSCWLCLKETCRRKSWSKVLGESRTRSVDTGMNELDRITGQIIAHEKLQEVRSSPPTAKGDLFGRWSFSCPALNESITAVSNDLLHSTLTSPGLFDTPTFISDFIAPFPTNEGDQSEVIPYQSLLTSSKHGSEGVSSTSPSVGLPLVCVEDEHNRQICTKMDTPPNNTRDEATLKASDKFPSDFFIVSDEDSEDGNSNNLNVSKSPLASRSAPSLHNQFEEKDIVVHDPDATPTRLNKSYSTPLTTEAETKSCLTGITSEFIDEEDEISAMQTRSEVLLSSPSTSPVHSNTPSDSPSLNRIMTHHKSKSVSGLPFNMDELNVNDKRNSLVIGGGMILGGGDDSRSRGSSFVSTTSIVSSKLDDEEDEMSSVTTDESEEEDFDPPVTNDSSAAILTSHLKILPRSDDEHASSEDDLLDGEGFSMKGRTDRRLSEVKITMIDDCSGSDEETIGHFRPLPRSSTADDALNHTSQLTDDRKNTSDNPSSSLSSSGKKTDLALSDIEVGVESLNNSFSGEYSKKMDMSPVLQKDTFFKGSLTRTSPKTAKQHNVSSGTSPKQTITRLQTLLKLEDQEDVPVFEQESGSDHDESFKGKRKKSQTLPNNSPTTFRKGPVRSHVESSTLERQHAKVSRNASTASDSKVPYKTATISKQQAECSSLDFIPPPEGRSSPRVLHPQGADSSNPPHSPLFFSRKSPSLERSGEVTSPKNLGSPLEKKISKSADNLLTETTSEQDKQISSPNKATPKKKEEPNNVKLLRFDPLPEDDRNTDEETNNRKDLKSYFGIEQTEKEQQPKKQTFRIFRRDSKKDKKPKKYESSTSVDSGNSSQAKSTGSNNQQAKNKPHPSPILRNKARSHTIHGDNTFSLVLPINEDVSPVKQAASKRSSQTIVRESISPVKEESISPTPTELSNSGDPEFDRSSLTIKPEEFADLMPSGEADVSWNRTVDRRLRKQMSKHEKGRQGVIYDWILTERHIYRAYCILKKVFYDKFKSELKMSDDELNQLFPSLSTLLSISQEFLKRLQDRQRQSGTLIQDISDILLDQFTGVKGERMKKAYTDFICRYPATTEFYRDLERKRHKFNRLLTALYQNKVCERKKLPDFYLLITQRVSKYVEMMKKLVKETEALKLDNLSRVKEASVALRLLVESIDRGVYEYNSNKELTDIQSRLEIHLPKVDPKNKKVKCGLKSLDFTAQNRLLIKRGDAVWKGHGKQIAVQIILVTDILVLLNERDQKLHLLTLQDSQAPVIKLYDLHVRVNAAVKSGIQLLLLEQGVVPEMFRLEFVSKGSAKEWEEALNKAIAYCKKHELKCEYFGAEPVLSGDELKDEDEDKGEGQDSYEPDPDLSPNSYRRVMISMAIDQANRILSSGPTSSGSFGGSMMTIEEARESPKPSIKNSKSTSQSKTMRTVSIEEPSKKKKVKVERGKSFLEKKTSLQEEHLEKQILMECIARLKDSVEYLQEQNEEQGLLVQRLRKEMESLKEERSRNSQDSSGSSPVTPRTQRAASLNRSRPLSLHSDMFVNETTPTH